MVSFSQLIISSVWWPSLRLKNFRFLKHNLGQSNFLHTADRLEDGAVSDMMHNLAWPYIYPFIPCRVPLQLWCDRCWPVGYFCQIKALRRKYCVLSSRSQYSTVLLDYNAAHTWVVAIRHRAWATYLLTNNLDGTGSGTSWRVGYDGYLFLFLKRSIALARYLNLLRQQTE